MIKRINMRRLINFAKLERVVAEKLLEDTKKAVLATTIETHHEVTMKQPVFKSALRNATQFKAPIVRGRGLIKAVIGEIFMIGNAALYGNVQDLGRKAGARWPPHAPIRRWVSLKLSRGSINPHRQQQPNAEQHQLDPRRSRRSAIDQATFLIRRKISKSPAKALHFFKKAEAGALLRLQRRMDDIAEEGVRRMGQ